MTNPMMQCFLNLGEMILVELDETTDAVSCGFCGTLKSSISCYQL